MKLPVVKDRDKLALKKKMQRLKKTIVKLPTNEEKQ
jgi:hypothetical protein